MLYHPSIYKARRNQVYYINGLEINFSPEGDPGFVPRAPTHTLADLIELYSDYCAFAADHEEELDDIGEAIFRMVHRITVHQGGAMVNDHYIWKDTYPEQGENYGWMIREEYEDEYRTFFEKMLERSIRKGSPAWQQEYQALERNLARDKKYHYYVGWDPRHPDRHLDLDLPIARNIKVVWTNPAPLPGWDPSEE
jgi:hypothetical protein